MCAEFEHTAPGYASEQARSEGVPVVFLHPGGHCLGQEGVFERPPHHTVAPSTRGFLLKGMAI